MFPVSSQLTKFKCLENFAQHFQETHMLIAQFLIQAVLQTTDHSLLYTQQQSLIEHSCDYTDDHIIRFHLQSEVLLLSGAHK